MKEKLWWLLAFFLMCALGATETYVCKIVDGEYVCELISEPTFE